MATQQEQEWWNPFSSDFILWEAGRWLWDELKGVWINEETGEERPQIPNDGTVEPIGGEDGGILDWIKNNIGPLAGTGGAAYLQYLSDKERNEMLKEWMDTQRTAFDTGELRKTKIWDMLGGVRAATPDYFGGIMGGESQPLAFLEKYQMGGAVGGVDNRTQQEQMEDAFGAGRDGLGTGSQFGQTPFAPTYGAQEFRGMNKGILDLIGGRETSLPALQAQPGMGFNAPQFTNPFTPKPEPPLLNKNNLLGNKILGGNR